MHQEVNNFLAEAKSVFPKFFTGKKVLEVGSLNINGSIRHHFMGCDYLGIDLGEGKDVDLVVPISEFKMPEYYDVIVCTEMLEHDHEWQVSLNQMYANLAPGGLFILTCAGPNRHEHGTKRTTPGDSPFTTDYYQNISKDMFKEALPKRLFSDYHLEEIRDGCDLQFVGVKAMDGDNLMDDVELAYGDGDLIFVTAQPDDRFFVWEVEAQIHNLRKYNMSDRYKCLVYWEQGPDKKMINPDWLMLKARYPEVEFKFYKENDKQLPINWVKQVYSSIIRPYILSKYFAENPHLTDKSIFYMDSDVIFLERPQIEKYILGDTIYMTDTRHYLDVDYMRRKAQETRGAIPTDHYVDILVSILGVDKQAYLNADKIASGGAQYVLKGVDAAFWGEVMHTCKAIKTEFARTNEQYFQEIGKSKNLSAEDAGIQSWCADMWAVYGVLVKRGNKIRTPDFMRSVWSSDPSHRLQGDMKGTIILHNAGIGGDLALKAFDKTQYRWGNRKVGRWPYWEDMSHVSAGLCSYYYAKALQQVGKYIDERAPAIK